nr:uncharacterized protein I203_02114 [Kwoniella mangroviensis CBS 8507]OCF68728.1 hypothetical protein I203_02114 [Kwoniella mangroviensis CBS 8507]
MEHRHDVYDRPLSALDATAGSTDDKNSKIGKSDYKSEVTKHLGLYESADIPETIREAFRQSTDDCKYCHLSQEPDSNINPKYTVWCKQVQISHQSSNAFMLCKSHHVQAAPPSVTFTKPISGLVDIEELGQLTTSLRSSIAATCPPSHNYDLPDSRSGVYCDGCGEKTWVNLINDIAIPSHLEETFRRPDAISKRSAISEVTAKSFWY